MKVILYILAGIILMVLQSSILSIIPVELFKPDFGIPFIIYTTLFLGPHSGLVTSVLMGFIEEMLSNAPHGSMLFTNVSIFLISTFLRNKLYIDSKYSFAFVCTGFVIIRSFLFVSLTFLSKAETRDMLNVAFYVFPNAIFTGFLSIFIFSLVEGINIKYFDKE